MTNEIFVSTDIEADGKIPGPSSMISLGSGAFTIGDDFEITLIDQYSVNLEELPNAGTDPETMAFWKENQTAWDINRLNKVPPKEAMTKYVNWLKSLPGPVVFTAWPATYDFLFVYWYLIMFAGESPFEWSGLDARTYFMAMIKKEKWIDMSINEVPKDWSPKNPHPHVAVYDAIEQGWMFCNMYIENLKGIK